MSIQKQNYDYLILPDGNYRYDLFGLKGDKGAPGVDGAKGQKGQHGENGTNGSKGQKGTEGQKGTDGTKGNKGDANSTLFHYKGAGSEARAKPCRASTNPSRPIAMSETPIAHSVQRDRNWPIALMPAPVLLPLRA